MNGWIVVEDKLPQKDVEVYCCYSTRGAADFDYIIGIYDEYGDWVDTEYNDIEGKVLVSENGITSKRSTRVTHWKYIESPYYSSHKFLDQ